MRRFNKDFFLISTILLSAPLCHAESPHVRHKTNQDSASLIPDDSYFEAKVADSVTAEAFLSRSDSTRAYASIITPLQDSGATAVYCADIVFVNAMPYPGQIIVELPEDMNSRSEVFRAINRLRLVFDNPFLVDQRQRYARIIMPRKLSTNPNRK